MLCCNYILTDISLEGSETCSFCGTAYEIGAMPQECPFDDKNIFMFPATNRTQASHLVANGWKVETVLVRDDVSAETEHSMLYRLLYIMTRSTRA